MKDDLPNGWWVSRIVGAIQFAIIIATKKRGRRQMRGRRQSRGKNQQSEVSRMDVSKQQARIDAITWYHEFDFGNGLRARTGSDPESHRQSWQFIEQNLDAVEFRNKSVLDIGCWDGYWSFNAERRGAQAVLATDDSTQNWAGSAGCLLAKELFDSSVTVDLTLSVYELASLDQRFDIILFFGVYYHLHAPFYALSQIRHCCHKDTIVLIEGPVALMDEPGGWFTPAVLPEDCSDREFVAQLYAQYLYRNPDEAGLRYFVERLEADEMTREAVIDAVQQSEERTKALIPAGALFNFANHACEWLPSMGVLEQLLHASYFSLHSLEAQGSNPPQGAEVGGEDSSVGAYAKKLREYSLEDEVLPLSSGDPTFERRMFLRCSPFEGVNELHSYRPPFGLHKYDYRYQKE